MLVERHDFAETGRGLRCTRSVEKGEELLVITLDECWHAAGALSEPELAPLVGQGAKLTELDAIALHLLIERSKGEGSARWAHLQEMPQAYDSTLFWSDEEREQLRGSNWLELSERFSDEVLTDWTALREQPCVAAILGEYSIGFSDYLWAYATVKSRAAELRVDGVPTRLLAPHFDLFNHSDNIAPGSSHYFDNDRRALVAIAAKPYDEGEQAFISYGPASNGSLLLGGGFVLPKNRFDAVDICITAECDARRLPIMMMVAPDAPPLEQEEASAFEFLQTPDMEELSGGTRPFITRHLLTIQNPLPPALLAYVRLERLSDVELTAMERKAEKAGTKIWDALNMEKPLDPWLDLLALAALRTVLQSKIDAYTTSFDADEAELAASPPTVGAANETAPPPAEVVATRRRWLALVLRFSEQQILRAAAARVDPLLQSRLREVLALAQAQDAMCRSSGLSWSKLLARRSATLVDAAPRISRAYERLASSWMTTTDEGNALLAQSGSALFLLLSGLGAHAYAPNAAFVPLASPFQNAGQASLEFNRSFKMLMSTEPELPYLNLYKSKMRMWGAYLLAQWGVARTLSLSEANTMQQESLALRNAHAWSVPTEHALAAVARYSPIVELGAGNGTWASALRARGVDVLAFDTPLWSAEFSDSSAVARISVDLAAVEEGTPLMGQRHGGVLQGGPEMASSESDRTLVLMWPDYAGRGRYGISCLRGYSGSVLVLVGEWRGATFGSYSAGLPETGQSFSAEFQAEVEDGFELVEEIPLPNWPYFLDRLAIWKRKVSATKELCAKDV